MLTIFKNWLFDNTLKKQLIDLLKEKNEDLSEEQKEHFFEILNNPELELSDKLASDLIITCLSSGKTDFLFSLLKKGLPLLETDFEAVTRAIDFFHRNNPSLNTLFCILYDITPSDEVHTHEAITFQQIIEYAQLRENALVNDNPELIAHWHQVLNELIHIEKDLVDDPIAAECLSVYKDMLEKSLATHDIQTSTTTASPLPR